MDYQLVESDYNKLTGKSFVKIKYKGKYFKVSGRCGYAVTLENNDFVWSLSNLEVM